MENYAIVLVESTNQAMRIEHIMHLVGIGSKLIPVPKFLSSACGNCLRIEREDMEKVKEVILKNRIKVLPIELVQM